jgi:hypothetical protein
MRSPIYQTSDDPLSWAMDNLTYPDWFRIETTKIERLTTDQENPGNAGIALKTGYWATNVHQCRRHLMPYKCKQILKKMMTHKSSSKQNNKNKTYCKMI